MKAAHFPTSSRGCWRTRSKCTHAWILNSALSSSIRTITLRMDSGCFPSWPALHHASKHNVQKGLSLAAICFSRPSHGGKFCQGSARTLKLCNSQKCPLDSVDFRAAQCAEYNSKHFRGWLYKWKPYTQVEGKFPVPLCRGPHVLLPL